MGGWPVVKGDSWDEKSWSWQKAALNCRRNGYSTDYIVDFSVGTDLKNSSTKIVDVSFSKLISKTILTLIFFTKQIDQPDLGLSQVFLLKGLENPVVKAYHSFQVDLAVLYGADKTRAEKEMRDALDFEIALANVRSPCWFFVCFSYLFVLF